MTKKISREVFEKMASEKGFKPAPLDHPIYSEGATIMFIKSNSHNGNRSESKKNLRESESNNQKVEGNNIDLGPVDIELRPGYSYSSNIWIRVLKDNKYEISILAENEEESYEYDDEDERVDNDLDEDTGDPVIEVVGEFTEEEAIEYLDEFGLKFPFK